MPDQLPANRHFQLRLVKRIDDGKIVTHQIQANQNSLGTPDKTMDFGGTEKGVLEHAKNYCERGAPRKGPLPGPFHGVVVVKHESNSSILELANVQNMPRVIHLKNRPRRRKGTTEWLFYVNPTGEAYHVTRIHHIGAKVSTKKGR